MEEKINVQLFAPAKEYLYKLSHQERAKLTASIQAVRTGDLDTVHTKQLDGPIREIIVGYHRMTYFVIGSVLYIAEGFRKKTAKTPKRYIDFAKKMYKYIKE